MKGVENIRQSMLYAAVLSWTLSTSPLTTTQRRHHYHHHRRRRRRRELVSTVAGDFRRP